ncbi:hypothetical protein BGW80DRAFT_674637 [Lactifluus volemus]|nr:hypothetical protein BGW80DRAFT_674637 [Lactifluus volemus]
MPLTPSVPGLTFFRLIQAVPASLKPRAHLAPHTHSTSLPTSDPHHSHPILFFEQIAPPNSVLSGVVATISESMQFLDSTPYTVTELLWLLVYPSR